MNKFFGFEEHKTTLKTEVIAGITTFMTMAYIIFVNPHLLGLAGMDEGAVMTATIVAAALSCILMGLMTNYPFALASGMGLNAFFAFTIAPKIGWEGALAAVFTSGVVFLTLALLGLINRIDEAVPASLKHAVAAGIGLFIAFIGFKNAGLVVANEATILGFGDLSQPSAQLCIIGLAITSGLMARQVKGSILIGIVSTTVISFFLGFQPFPESLSAIVGRPASMSPVMFKLNFSHLMELGIMTIFALVFVDLFDTMGTLMGTGARAGFLDADNNLPKVKQAMIADAIGTMSGAILGTSTVTTYVESTSGVIAGGRTGLTSIVVGIMFLLSLFFAPFAALVPEAATAPALIIVGVLMVGAVKRIDFEDFSEALPAFLTIVVMPFAFSIAHGIAAGFIAYPLVKVCAGKRAQLNWLNYVLAVLSILHFLH